MQLDYFQLIDRIVNAALPARSQIAAAAVADLEAEAASADAPSSLAEAW